MIAPVLRALLVASGLTLAAPLAAQTSELAAARASWRAAGLDAYEYGYQKFCECHGEAPPETLVTVEAGAVVNVRHRPANSTREVPAQAGNFQYYWTIDGLFDLIESALGRGATVRVRFDVTRGYPTSVFIDYVESTIGDEVDVRITQLREL